MTKTRPCFSFWPLALLLLSSALPAAGQTRDPEPPIGLEIEPNAIQDPAKPMGIRVTGISRGETVHFQVLQDCNGDDRPDLEGTPGCESPLFHWESPKAGAEGVWDLLNFRTLRREGHELPENRKLWLRVTRKGSNESLSTVFGLVTDPCQFWKSLLDTFKPGPCSLGRLSQALLRHRGATTWKNADRFEVRRLDLGKEPFRPIAVPGTQGATGLAWVDDRTLLVTVAPAAGPSRLLRVPLSGRNAEILWEVPSGETRLATAPLALPGDRVAFVRQVQGASSALLSVWEKGKVDPARDLELPGSIHQLIAADPEGKEILALTLGVEESQPAFLRIDLVNRSVEFVDFDPSLYEAIFRSAKGDNAIVAFVDNSGHTGWDLALANAPGKLPKDVQTRPEDDLLPAWQPNGGGIAFLAELERDKEKP